MTESCHRLRCQYQVAGVFDDTIPRLFINILKLPVPPMRVRCLTSLKKLEPYADDWERLAEGMPFRSWTWLQHWWRHYGLEDNDAARQRLAVLCVFDARTLVGIAPWYYEYTAIRGRTLRPLGWLPSLS